MPNTADRRADLSAMATALDYLRKHAEEIGEATLALLIAQAMDEARQRAE